MSETRIDTYQRITDTIISALEAETRPWVKPWNASHIGSNFPRPLRSNGEPYRGINVLLLWLATAEHGFEYERFMTYRQAQEFGGQVRKGERGTLIVKYGTVTKKGEAAEDEDREIPYVKGYTVFNLSQIVGLSEEHYASHTPLPAEQRIKRADDFATETRAIISHGGNHACYIPATDQIQMPPFAAFVSPEAYYATLFHELAHWTGGRSRLDRISSTNMQTKGYAFEELIAEITACFICSDLSLAVTVRDESASYLASWLKYLKEDKKAIFRAASRAQAAADYLHQQQESRVVS